MQLKNFMQLNTSYYFALSKLKLRITNYLDAVKFKFGNRSLTISKKGENNYVIEFKEIAKIPAELKICEHYRLRSNLHVTRIGLSEESLEGLVLAYCVMKQLTIIDDNNYGEIVFKPHD